MTSELTPYRAQIEAALGYAGGTHTYEDIERGVASGIYQSWPAPESIIVTAIERHPQASVLWFFLAGGNLAEIERMVPHVLAWGKTQGCVRAAFTGRRGWERTFLTRTGWAVNPLVTLETEL